jgi:hypothetical protein
MFNSFFIFSQEGGVLLTTYDIVRNNYKLIRGNSYNNYNDEEEEIIWNYVILDEGHVIKNNKTQRAQSLFEIPCVHRIVISGTPIQNNLKVFLQSPKLFVMRYLLCAVSKSDYRFRKCGLCSISVAQTFWVINNSNSLNIYFSEFSSFVVHFSTIYLSLLFTGSKQGMRWLSFEGTTRMLPHARNT